MELKRGSSEDNRWEDEGMVSYCGAEIISLTKVADGQGYDESDDGD